MKRKIKLVDNINKKVVIKEVKIRDYDHFMAQQSFKSVIHKDKTKIIPRKQKYKTKAGDE